MQKEKEAADLKQKYFGPEGELFKKRESLMTPIQEEIYNAVKDISELRGYRDVGVGLSVYGKSRKEISFRGCSGECLASALYFEL